MSTTTPHVDPSNRTQAQAWDGTEGGYWATHADRFDLALAHYQPAFHAAAGIGAGRFIEHPGRESDRWMQDCMEIGYSVFPRHVAGLGSGS